MQYLLLRRSMRWATVAVVLFVASVVLVPGAAADAERVHSGEPAAEQVEPGSAATDDGLTLQSDSSSFTAVAAGGSHSCAIRNNQAIICWGLSLSGQTHAPFGTFTAVAAGGSHSCAIRTSQSVVCWGSDQHGQTDAPSGSFTAVAAGGSHSCALRTSESVVCWGDNRHGQTDVPSGSFTAVAAGGSHSCAIRTGQSVVCWGSDQHGQTDAPSGSFTAVAAGASHSCGLSADESVVCWGNNQHGRTDVPQGPFAAVAAGGSHTCAIRSSQRVVCWGDSRNGMALPRAGSFTAVAAGESHTCGLLGDRSITCWGDRKGNVPNIIIPRSSGSGDVHDRSIDALRSNYRGIFDLTSCTMHASCKNEPLPRWEMAVWLVRILDGSLGHTYRAPVHFRDVPWGYGWSEYPGRLAEIGVTAGCSSDPPRYCPMKNVTRGQMATFLVRVFDLESAPAAGFTDTQDSAHRATVDALFAAGITAGCKADPLQFCPHSLVSRRHMATFLARALRIL